jgi:N-methylhydantoinase A
LRYPGQEHTVNVPIDFAISENSRDKIYEKFSNVYKRTFGYTLDRPAEMIGLRVRSIGEVTKPVIHELETGSKNADAAIKGKRQVFCFVNNKFIDHTIYERSRLLAGNVIDGPALIEEPTSVTNVLIGYKCEVDNSGSLIITRR